MIERSNYTDLIKLYIDRPFIKAITGLHRCGKTTVLLWVRRELKRRGIGDGDILYLNFETVAPCGIADGQTLLETVRCQRAGTESRLYLLLDEIPYLPGWEQAVKELYRKENCDIYLTGSSCGLLGGADGPLIARNCVQIRMYPYSYSEFREQLALAEPEKEESQCFLDFLRYGSMPGIHALWGNGEAIRQYLLDVCRAGILKDALRDGNLRNVDQLWMILGYLAEHLGEPLSPKAVSDGLNRAGRQVSKDTVYAVLKALEEGHIIYRARRFDIKEGRAVEAREKYYFSDWGMYHALKGFRDENIPAVLENIVYMELLSRGYRVYRGKIGRREFDFLAERGREQYCIQVREHIADEQALKEAAGPLGSLKGSYKKLVLSLDETMDGRGVKDIARKNLAAFLENA